MVGFNKQELYLGQFVNMFLQALLKSKTGESLPEKGSLTDKEIKLFKEELFYFRVELLMAKLIVINKFGKTEFSNYEIGKTVGSALILALRDTGMSKADSDKIEKKFIKHLGIYEDYIDRVDESEMNKTGPYFQILQCFTNLVIGKDINKLSTEADRDKNFIVFSYGKQAYKSDEQAFNKMYKSVKFLD